MPYLSYASYILALITQFWMQMWLVNLSISILRYYISDIIQRYIKIVEA